MVGDEDATIDLGTDDPILFGAEFSINKTIGAKVELINHHFGRMNSYTMNLSAGDFYSNNYNITGNNLSILDQNSDHIVDLGTSTVTLSGQFFPVGTQIHPQSKFVFTNPDTSSGYSSDNSISCYYGATVQLESLTFAGTRHVVSTGYGSLNILVKDLIIDAQTILFYNDMYYTSGGLESLSITNTLELKQATQVIFNKNSTTATVTNVEVGNIIESYPTADLSNRSFLIGFRPVTMKITGGNTNTQNITYQNITLDTSGATLTAPQTGNGGLNSGFNWTSTAAQDYYWIGGDGFWDDPANWSNNSGGGAGTSVPTATDHVYFDANSFSSYGQAVTLRAPAFCANISWAGANKKGSLNVSNYDIYDPSIFSLSVQGDADFSGANLVQPTLYFLGVGAHTLNSGNSAVYDSPYIYVQAGAGSYTLTSDFIMNTKRAFIHTSGLLDLNEYTLDIGCLESALEIPVGSSRSLDFENSQIFTSSYNNPYPYLLSGQTSNVKIVKDYAGFYNFGGSHFHISDNTAGSSNSRLFYASGQFDFHDITFADRQNNELHLDNNTTIRNLTFNGSGTFSNMIVDSLILSPSREYNFEYGVTVEINRGLDARTSGCQAVTISGYDYSPSTIKNNTGNVMSINGAIIKNIYYDANGSQFDKLLVPNGIDLGNNTNVDITAAAPRDFYWVGGTGNWSDANHWSFTSGGPGNGTCLPSLNDVVYFDKNSFTADYQVVTLDISPLSIKSMIWTPEAGAKKPEFAGSSYTINLSGSLQLASGMTVNTIDSHYLYFTGDSMEEDAQMICTNGVQLSNFDVRITGSGRFDLRSDFLPCQNFSLSENSSFYTNNYDLSVYYQLDFYKTKPSTVVDLGTSVIEATLLGNYYLYTTENFHCQNASFKGGMHIMDNWSGGGMPLKFKSIEIGYRDLTSESNANRQISVEKIFVNSARMREDIRAIGGNFVTDTLQISSVEPELKIYENTTLTVNKEIVLETGAPCQYFPITSTGNDRATLKINYCDPVLYYASMQNIDVDFSDAVCSGPQSLLVYGKETTLGTTSGITFIEPGNPAKITLPDIVSACLPYNFQVSGNITSYTLYQLEEDLSLTEVPTDGISRYIPITESATYTLRANYMSGTCTGEITFKLDIDAYRTWTGAANSTDWTDPNNWDKGVPEACSFAIIPGGLSYYPEIQALDYAVCGVIDIRFGGEVKNTHLLTYSSAKVEMKFNSKQWYMLSPPLQNMYSGDFYVSDPNPHVDGYKMYAMLFNAENPQTNKTVGATWSGTFNTANQLLPGGTGVTLWAQDDKANQDEVVFQFPKPDTNYLYYNSNGNVVGSTGTIARDNSHRFVYENALIDDETVQLSIQQSVRAGEAFVIGNPFMTHLDFEEFYSDNSSQIEGEYSLATGVSVENGKINTISTFKLPGTTTGPVSLTKLIAPMQSFIVKSKVDSPNLKAKADSHTVTSVTGTNILRNANNYRPDYMLEITAEREQQTTSRISLAYEGNASQTYVPEEDSYTLFSTNSLEPVVIYTRSSDGYALDVNAISGFERIIPLGIRTSKQGEIRLKFAGMESFKNEVKIYLHDTQLNRVVDLSWQNEYVFNKEDAELYSENRFFLSFGNVTGIGNPDTSTGLIVRQSAPQTIEVSSSDGSVLKNLRITNLQGQNLIMKAETPSGYTYQVNVPGVYIVRATGSENTEVKKVLVK
jgi:hypothetical protein